MAIHNIERRAFLKLTGLSIGGLHWGISLSGQAQPYDDDNIFTPNVFVSINTAGDTFITICRSEMGQGIRTSFAQIIADEMEADWQRVKILQADANAQYGDQATGASNSISSRYNDMRIAGATVRYVFEQAASKRWQVSAMRCRAINHFVVNLDTNQQISYGELIEIAETIPLPKNPPLKKNSEFRYIGKQIPGRDVDDICHGRAVFSMDIKLENMRYASIIRSPIWGGNLKTLNTDKALSHQEVEDIFRIDRIDDPHSGHGGVAVIAKNSWGALRARDDVIVEWDLPKRAPYNQVINEWQEKVRTPGIVDRGEGDYYKIAKDGNNIITAEYQSQLHAHAMIEPPVCVADVRKTRCEIWAPVQTPQLTQNVVAKLLGMKADQVKVHVTLIGGAFGRKSLPDFVLEAVQISQAIKKPVKLLWSREDEFLCSFHGAPSTARLEAALDKKGYPVGWLHRSAFPSVMTIYTGKNKPANWETRGGMSGIPYTIPSIQIEHHEVDSPTRIGPVRGVTDYFHHFASNSFTDELAAKAGVDSLEFHLQFIGKNRDIDVPGWARPLNTARLKRTIKEVGLRANWGQERQPNHGLGLGFGFLRLGYQATVVEVKIDPTTNSLDLLNVWSVVDIGTVINPGTVEAQVTGGVLFGLSTAIYEELTPTDKGIKQSNYHDYNVMRIHQVPNIYVSILQSEEPPSGLGESSSVPVVAALTNAIYSACGKRVRKLPIGNQLK